uniref:Cyclin D-type-binding-protein 1 n=1 Tax=Xenopus tropicalis TaxID=8364 RepID=A0A6I8SAL1_XENTR
ITYCTESKFNLHVLGGRGRVGGGLFPIFFIGHSIKATSQEATKLSLAFLKPPLPSEEGSQKLCDGLLNAILADATVYYSLPKEQGITLRKTVREAVADIIEGTIQLAEVILSSRIQSLSQAQLVSTGSVWEACDQWEKLPKDNLAAVQVTVSGYLDVVKDAIEEVEQAQADGEDPFSDIPEDDEVGARGNQDTYWSEEDRRLMAPCLGLMKASKACLKKILGAIKAHGKADTAEHVAQLDDLVDVTLEVSPSVDELALSLYPPMNHATVRLNAAKLSSVLKKVFSITRSSHVCPDTESAWVQFLDSAVDHNMEKTKNLTQGAL